MILKNIRALRIKRCETILDMAERLNMRITVLSAIENGKIKIPDNFLENLFGIYNFTSKEKEEFIKNHNKDTPSATTPSFMLFAFGDSTNDLGLMQKGIVIPAAPSNAKSDVLTYVKSVNGYIAPQRELKGSTSNIANIAQDMATLFFAYGKS